MSPSINWGKQGQWPPQKEDKENKDNKKKVVKKVTSKEDEE